MFVCICRGITEAAVRRAGEAGVTEPDALVAAFELDDEVVCCGQCRADIGEFVSLAQIGLARAVQPVVALSAA